VYGIAREQKAASWRQDDMISKTLGASADLQFLLATFFAAPLSQMAQERGRDRAPVRVSSFVGTWKGVCADGKEFVILTLNQNGADIGGTVSIANIRGEAGQCATVVNPPSPEHAMKISDAQVQGTVLAFKASQRAEFQMTLVGAESALLKFLGTPLEDKPWELKKAK
jgi:hypothetical protein